MASPTWGLGSLTGISWVPPLSRYCEELGTALLVGAGGGAEVSSLNHYESKSLVDVMRSPKIRRRSVFLTPAGE